MRNLIVLVVCLVCESVAATTLNTNNMLTPIPSSAVNRLWMGVTPDDGSTQTLNPPFFKWVYDHNNPPAGYPATNIEVFRLQISTNNFTGVYFDQVTSNNFLNTIPAITNADGSSWSGLTSWHVIYMTRGGSIESTGAVHTFTLTSSAQIWDRSKYGASSYWTGLTHPYMFFNTNNRAAMATSLHANTTMGFFWTSITNAAASAVAQSWWNDDSFTNQEPSQWAESIMDVALTYQIDSNAFWKSKNPGQMVSRFASQMAVYKSGSTPYTNIDSYTMNETPRAIALGYDWTYDDMTTAQRSNTQWCAEQFSNYYLNSDDWWYQYGGLSVNYDSAPKINNSHGRHDAGTGVYLGMAFAPESAFIRDHLTYYLNWQIGQADPFNGDEGRGYAEQSWRTLHNFGAQLLLCCLDPQFTNQTWYLKYPTMFCFWEPINYVDSQDQWGDFALNMVGGVPNTYQFNYKYYDIAIMYQCGPILKQHLTNYAVRSQSPDQFFMYGEAFLPFYFTHVPSQADWPSNCYFNALDGWLMSYQYPPNSSQCFTNGVGFLLSARPAGNRVEHGEMHDGSPQIFAYGAQVTVGNVGNYYKHPMFLLGLFVNGIGDSTPNGNTPTFDTYAKFLAETNTDSYTFGAVDLTRCFNNTNGEAWAGGGDNSRIQAYNLSTNTRPFITGVTREVLFVKTNYPFVVMYDHLTSSSNYVYQWKWNVLTTNGLVIDTNGCKFQYPVTNYFNNSNVMVYVAHMGDTSTMTLTNVQGTNVAPYVNPFTSEDISADCPVVDGPRFSNAIWVYNKAASTDWHFMSVIAIQKWTDPAPTITRNSDVSATIAQGDNTTTVTRNPDGTWTLTINGTVTQIGGNSLNTKTLILH